MIKPQREVRALSTYLELGVSAGDGTQINERSIALFGAQGASQPPGGAAL